MSADKPSSKADTLVKLVLVVFISLLSFSVGTFVGKQVSDSDHRRLALEGDTQPDRSVAALAGHVDGHSDPHVDASEKITEKEIESLTEEFVNKEKSAREPAADDAHEVSDAPAPAPESMTGDAGYKSYPRGKTPTAAPTELPEARPMPKVAEHSSDATHKIAEKVARDEAPTDGMKEVRKPTSALPSVASSAIGKYTVQVASYAEEKEAKGHAAGLKGKGWNAFYLPADVNGRTWYRVLVGLFNNTKTANDFRAQFMKEANTQSAIVQKIIQ